MNNINWLNPLNFGEKVIEGAQDKLSLVVSSLFKDLVLSSYWICLIGGIIGIILYALGARRCKNYPVISIGVYLIIQILGSVLID